MSHCLLVVLVRLVSTKLVVVEFDILSVECRVIDQSQRNVDFLSGKQLIALLASTAEYDQCLAHLLFIKNYLLHKCCSRCRFQPYDSIIIRFVEWIQSAFEFC